MVAEKRRGLLLHLDEAMQAWASTSFGAEQGFSD